MLIKLHGAEWDKTDVSLDTACGSFPARPEDYNIFIWTGFIGPVRKHSPIHSGQISLRDHLLDDNDLKKRKIRQCDGTAEAQ